LLEEANTRYNQDQCRCSVLYMEILAREIQVIFGECGLVVSTV
jgi:hypothetical protein